MCPTSTGAWEKFINYEDKISMLKSSHSRDINSYETMYRLEYCFKCIKCYRSKERVIDCSWWNHRIFPEDWCLDWALKVKYTLSGTKKGERSLHKEGNIIPENAHTKALREKRQWKKIKKCVKRVNGSCIFTAST